MDNLTCVEVSLVIVGKNLDLNELTNELGINPTETRDINDWPEVIKNNPNLPEELQPRYSWCISQRMNLCKQIEIPIKKIMSQLKGKEQRVIDFCEKYALIKSMCITIHAEAMSLPEIVLPSYAVAYFGKLGVKIGFDIYTY